MKAVSLKEGEKVRFGFHDLRHSLASSLARKGTDVKTLQKMLRHRDVTTMLWRLKSACAPISKTPAVLCLNAPAGALAHLGLARAYVLQGDTAMASNQVSISLHSGRMSIRTISGYPQTIATVPSFVPTLVQNW